MNIYPEKYNLNWHTYSDHLREMLHDMSKSQYLTDVTLVCDDKKQIKAHRIVLSACSPIFKCIIDNQPQNNSIIYLRGIQHQEMEALVEFMYLGVASVYQERMNDFLKVAKDLEIKDICKNIEFAHISKVSAAEEITKKENTFESLENNEVWEMEAYEQKNNGIFNDTSYSTPQTLSKKFSCNQCDYESSWRHNLIRHIQSHEGIKHACNQCKYQT